MNPPLDARQRAMLEEMGVRVWQPASTTSAQAEPAEMAPTATDAPVPPKEASIRPAPSAVLPHTASPSTGVRPTSEPDPRPDLATMGWDELQQAVAHCNACGLCKSRRNTVFGVGHTAARWLVVGEAPGEQEDLQGEPFVGPAGQLLDNMLKALGLSRHSTDSHSVYIANVLKCRPPANRNPSPEEVLKCEPFLRRQVALLQPTVILALGRFAAQSVLQDSVADVAAVPLGRLRGQVHHYQGVPVIVSYHPAYLLRTPQDKAKAWADLCLALEVQQQAAVG